MADNDGILWSGPTPDEETPCPKSQDGAHCECWYDGESCCHCGEAGVGVELRSLSEFPFSESVNSTLKPLPSTAAKEYREARISPNCPDCQKPCCVFGPTHPCEGIWVNESNISLFTEVAMAHAWPLSFDAKQEVYHRIKGMPYDYEGYRGFTDGPCPAWISGLCAVYDDKRRPDACGLWPVFDQRELHGNWHLRIEGTPSCPHASLDKFLSWCQTRAYDTTNLVTLPRVPSSGEQWVLVDRE